MSLTKTVYPSELEHPQAAYADKLSCLADSIGTASGMVEHEDSRVGKSGGLHWMPLAMHIHVKVDSFNPR